jgi:hypothetical protein
VLSVAALLVFHPKRSAATDNTPERSEAQTHAGA